MKVAFKVPQNVDFALKNGATVFVVKNSKVLRISYQGKLDEDIHFTLVENVELDSDKPVYSIDIRSLAPEVYRMINEMYNMVIGASEVDISLVKGLAKMNISTLAAYGGKGDKILPIHVDVEFESKTIHCEATHITGRIPEGNWMYGVWFVEKGVKNTIAYSTQSKESNITTRGNFELDFGILIPIPEKGSNHVTSISKPFGNWYFGYCDNYIVTAITEIQKTYGIGFANFCSMYKDHITKFFLSTTQEVGEIVGEADPTLKNYLTVFVERALEERRKETKAYMEEHPMVVDEVEFEEPRGTSMEDVSENKPEQQAADTQNI